MEEAVSMPIIDSISNFRLLSSINPSRAELVQRYCRKIDDMLDLMRMVLDGAFPKIISDNKLSKMLDELDATVNEASELAGSWNPMMSKIYFVTQAESIITKMQTYVRELCEAVNYLMLQSESSCVPMHLENLERTYCEKISVLIREASRDIARKVTPKSEKLAKIQATLSLCTNQELLMEAVALTKIKMKGNSEDSTELDGINDIIGLVNLVLDKHVEEKQMRSINGVPIPADFCCPLSLELMSDPVIVASGQTYEQVFIKKWLDMGYNVCPKTRQTLGHTKLIPNYTVKQLIENWCEIHGIVLPDPVELLSLSFPVSLNITNGSPRDKSPSYDSSPGANRPVSPEHNEFSVLHPKARFLLDGSYRDDLIHENSDSDDRISSFEDTDESESDSLRLSATSAPKKSLCDERTDGSTEVHTQMRDGGLQLQVSDVDKHLKCNGSSDSSSHLEPGKENVRAQVLSDSNVSEVTQDCPVATCTKVELDVLPGYDAARSRNQSAWRRQSDRTDPGIVLSTSTDSRSDSPDVMSKVRRLVGVLQNGSFEFQRSATEELRILSRHSMEDRITIANCGAVPFLVTLLHSSDPSTQENAVTILLNLSLNDNNKIAIANAKAIEPLIHVLQVGNPEAKANAAATLFSLSVNEENKVRIGRSGAIKPLVDLLGDGTPQGKRDAATALFNLSIFHENKARIVQAGAVKHLVELMDPAAGMVDKAVAVLANLSTAHEGRNDIAQAGGIPVLVEVVELGSARSKENAAAALLQLCTNSNRFCSLVLQEGAVPPLVALSQSGTARAREKAQVLLSYFRNQRHLKVGRG